MSNLTPYTPPSGLSGAIERRGDRTLDRQLNQLDRGKTVADASRRLR